MLSKLLVCAAVAAGALGWAPSAAADPAPIYFDDPGHYENDVPGMDYGAQLNMACPFKNVFTFGRGPGGEPLQCRFVPNQWPPVPTDTGFWQATYDLVGVQKIGAPCPRPQSAAQAPDGRPLVCMAAGWQPGIYTRPGFRPL